MGPPSAAMTASNLRRMLATSLRRNAGVMIRSHELQSPFLNSHTVWHATSLNFSANYVLIHNVTKSTGRDIPGGVTRGP